MKTKISLILLGLGLVSGSALAAHADEMPMPVSNDINVTAPDQAGMWSFGGTALLLQRTGGNFDYADGVTNGATAVAHGDTAGSINSNTVDQQYNWWFGADVTYAFPGNGRDVMLAYEGMHSTTSNSAGGTLSSPFDYSANSSGSYSSNGHTFTDASGKVETNYGAGDLVFGQKMDIGTRVRLHPFAGVRYAYINEKDTASYAGGSYTTVAPIARYGVAEDAELNSKFSGIGPRFGTDAQVNLGQGFSVRGRLGLSALIGSRKADNSFVDGYYNAAGALVYTDAQSANVDSETRVVPEMDGRIGLNYTYNFASNMDMGVELGWQAENYFNSTVDVNNNVGNFALQGPYARVQLDVA